MIEIGRQKRQKIESEPHEEDTERVFEYFIRILVSKQSKMEDIARPREPIIYVCGGKAMTV